MIYWPLIDTFEGNTLVGYVPKGRDGKVEGHSGVTVARGVDLGQDHHLGYIDSHLSGAELRALLDPYMGMTGETAAAFLAAHPLTITPAQRETLNTAMEAAHVAALRFAYNRAIVPGLRSWDALTTAQQTVIASVGWQYGDLAEKCPHFWGAAVAQQWGQILAELRDFGDAYPNRRKREADYLGASLTT